MPNIELHGYGEKAAIAVRENLRASLLASSIADEIVTTTFPSDVENLKGETKPFLRIITGPEDLDELKERLKLVFEDIEVLILHEWIPNDFETQTRNA